MSGDGTHRTEGKRRYGQRELATVPAAVGPALGLATVRQFIDLVVGEPQVMRLRLEAFSPAGVGLLSVNWRIFYGAGSGMLERLFPGVVGVPLGPVFFEQDFPCETLRVVAELSNANLTAQQVEVSGFVAPWGLTPKGAR